MIPEAGRSTRPTASEDTPAAAGSSSVVERLLQPHREPFRSPPGLALRQFMRRNLLLFVSTLIFLGVIVLVVLQIDTAHYQVRKRELLSRLFVDDRLREDPLLDELGAVTNIYTTSYIEREGPETPQTRENRERMEARFRDLGTRLLAKYDSFLVVIELVDRERRPILSVGERNRQALTGDFRNSLIPRPFVQEWTQTKKGPSGTLLIVALRAPKGHPQIEALTRQWQGRVLLIVGGLLLLYLLFLSRVLLPVRNLIRALDKGAAVGAPVIAKPRTLLEKYYNNLARDATLSLLSTALRDYVASNNVVDQQPVLELVPGLIVELFPFRAASVIVLRYEDEGDEFHVESHLSAGADTAVAAPILAEIRRQLTDRTRGLTPAEWDGRRFELGREHVASTPLCVEIAGIWERHVALLAVQLPGGVSQAAWWRDLAVRATREVRYALHAVAEQRRLILTEKSKANISLSNNIGHDLTNIIATSKLELMSLKTLLEMPREEVYGSPRKMQIFRESLEALLNNTRFLQETVNLYRSFSYLSRPRFEEVDLNALVRDVAALFQLSLSRAITVHTEPDERLGPIEVEPRLMRLALFNLLSNAADSIKRVASADKPAGEIHIRVHANAEAGMPEIVVDDSGGGIRDPEGRLLDPHEIDAIFQLGFSTKEMGASEGLGLNWVRQIVCDFHGGELAAANRPEGGARFTIALPSHRLEPARPAQVLLDKSSGSSTGGLT
ncbi:MAG: HAMP domain-containing histidine kinase [Candidatus Sumerlaeia bacterium]|nr:HAMP domain-containing histidine kinase [Candidatus Sumerlaeia bacterium]